MVTLPSPRTISYSETYSAVGLQAINESKTLVVFCSVWDERVVVSVLGDIIRSQMWVK